MKLSLGVKSDPIEYRYSYEWLFDLMAEAKAPYLQLGSFTEMFSLEPEWFARLGEKAKGRGITIKSVFTSHRELGGLFSGDPSLGRVAIENYRRLIDVGAAVGADYVGSNLGRSFQDRFDEKVPGMVKSIEHLKNMMAYAKEKGLKGLSVEPMSCLAEPPTLPEECTSLMLELGNFHKANPNTVPCYFCSDISHGYADAEGVVVHDNWSLFRHNAPWTCEFHFKNTDKIFNSTFGFNPEERERGIVKLDTFRNLIDEVAPAFPVERVVGYLEIGGPKHGRDYSDINLGKALKESLAALNDAFDFAP
jgi:Xylose isomerase-like TIM barrel.